MVKGKIFKKNWDLLKENNKQIIILLTLLMIILASIIGYQQMSINKKALDLDNYVELFAMPQQIIDPNNQIVGFNVLIKNVGSHPIYLINYTLNDNKRNISSVIPASTDSWYSITLPEPYKLNNTLNLTVIYRDRNNNYYSNLVRGSFNGFWWEINTEAKRRYEN